ncbi:MAG: zinc-binding dehydrogenase [Jatrophihabitantaceae bacterium]
MSCFADHVVVAAASLVPISSAIPLPVAALFGCALMTGVGSVINTARVRPGASLAIFGLGGVGMAVLLGASLAGAHPIIVIDPSGEKRQLAEELGATYSLSPHESAVEQIRALSGGGVEYAFDAVGATEVLADAFHATGRGGTTVAVGLPHPDRTLELPAAVITAEARHLVGSYMGSAVPVRDVPRLVALYQAGRLPVERLLSRSVRLSEINSALDDLAAGTLVRQVITPGR